jgi:hypothetical protein
MIPDNQNITKNLNKDHLQNIILKGDSYFAKAEEYVTLQKEFIKESLFEIILFWVDTIIYPAFQILSLLWKRELPSMFSVFSFQKTFDKWVRWFRFKTLSSELKEWVEIVKSVNGPFIRTNDPDYHVFVYADGMQRLRSGLLTKKGAKSS